MKKTLLTTLLCSIFLVISMSCVLADDNARHLIDNLYMSPGRLPINDLVADAEVYTPVEKKQVTGGSALVLSSKDKMIFKKPNKLRVDSIIHDPGGPQDGKSMTIIRDGAMRWMYLAVGQFPVKKGADVPSATLNLPPNLQTYKQDVNNTYSLKGKEKIGSVTASIVQADNVNGESLKVWVDTSKWVPVKLEKSVPDPKGGAPSVKTCLYSDFRKLKDGRWFPFSIEIKKGGVTMTLVKYTALSINVGINDDMFEPMKKFSR